MTRDELLQLIDRAYEEGWEELDLAGNDLEELPPEVGKLTQLKTLILGKVEKWEWVDKNPIPTLITNRFTTLPSELSALQNLRTLDLSGNPFAVIPEVVFGLQPLTCLTLTSIGLSEIPNSIVQLTNLTELYLHNNQITQIPDSITHLTNLIELSLSSNQITQIPDSITHLINLAVLNLRDNAISAIPDSIAQLANLTELYLHNNQITQIPNSIAQLTNLTVLNLGGNEISAIPDSIAQLTNLKGLYLWSNQITQIPHSIAQLTNLKELALDGNQITQIPNSIAQLTNLTRLHLDSNQITQIPDSIAQLANLTILSLHRNQITQIPDSIAQLANLTILSLHRNQITQIPDSIAQLANLTMLSLQGTQITQIPHSIAQLTNLTMLDLEGNQIAEIPSWLEDLPNLKKLDLRHNPLPISPEVLGPADLKQEPGPIEGIFNYCRQLCSGKVRPLNEAKILLVGQGSVGKTSLINRLLDNQFNSNEPQTDGLNVRTWNVHVNSKDVRLNVWDFGGQEIYHATHQFFLTKRSLYLLVCNCRTSEEENRIEYWLKLIESFGDQSPVIIIGNKKDEQPLDINRKALRDKYPNIKAILETSCQTNDGIDELRQAITKEVGELSDVYNLLPLSWFEVKEHLEHLDQDFISYSQYACICALNQIPEEHNQEQLIGLLHNLGLVLNFRDHPILQSTSVLNPDWVTQGIYALLSDEILKTETKGILNPEDLTRILDPQRYPANRHHYLTELMKEFQLCFPLSDCPTPKFLIPGLLPKEEAEDTHLTGDTLEFQYHYRILPDSIISRFIVLMHDKIHDHIYWRSGVMLAYREGSETYNTARIKTDPEDRKIFISIDGRETTRRLFLGLIRDTFNKIHSSFGNLEVSEWVPVPGHPDHPPLDYQDLLCLEEMGDRVVTVPRLKLRVDLRQLLDGYEPIEARQRRRMEDGDRLEMHIHGDYIYGDKVGNDKVGNDKIGNDKIGRDKIEN